MVVPSYYKDFRCIADKCRHSCCIGWEIDIDSESHARYLSDSSSFGERLRSNITGDPPHFILSADERCPFLNEKGLCDIIIEKGERFLCNICTEHPRFYNEWGSMTEAGIGLCCEEAARIVLSQEKPFTFINEGKCIDDDHAKNLYNFRNHLIDTVFTAENAEDAIVHETKVYPFSRTVSEWADFYLGLERLDDKWTAVLEKLKLSSDNKTVFPNNMQYRNLLAYFLYRHMSEALDDDDIASKVGFALLSCRIIFTAYYIGCGDFYELARMYSSEIEYSEENLSALYDELWEENQNNI